MSPKHIENISSRRLFLAAISLCIGFWALSQTKPFPDDYPPFGTIGTWGYTSNGTNWDTQDYEAFVYNQIPFRLMAPNGVEYDEITDSWDFSGVPDPDKKFPVFLFLHGIGEAIDRSPYDHPTLGLIGNNNRSLLHGGKKFRDDVNGGNFDGYIFVPHTDQFVDSETDRIIAIIDSLIRYNRADPDRIFVNGLSSGGGSTWSIAKAHPKVFTAALPMSNASIPWVESNLPDIVHIPIWLSQGQYDNDPTLFSGNGVHQAWLDAGGLMHYKVYPTGHGTWNNTWDDPDLWPWVNARKKYDPLVFYQIQEFCPEITIDARFGFTPGFDEYQWRENGILMAEDSNVLIVDRHGDFQGRFRRDTVWTPWSDTITISERLPTPAPTVTLANLNSLVLPSPDGATSVTFTVPDIYDSYSWFESSSPFVILSTTNTLAVSDSGQYQVKVTEVQGCESAASNSITLLTSSGPGSPEPPLNAGASIVSPTETLISWDQDPSPTFNELGFEIYRGQTSGGPYQLVHITGPDETSYLDNELSPDDDFYYILRTYNDNGASVVTPELLAQTPTDTVSPSAPKNVLVGLTTPSTVQLTWNASSDNVGVSAYDIYEGGALVTSTSSTTAIISGLAAQTLYNFYVVARDQANNVSSPSNQVSAATIISGLTYHHYSGSWTSLPDFDALTPDETDTISTFNIDKWQFTDNFAVKFEGFINIPTEGQYTFYTSSDDGSKLYIGGFSENFLVVNNDGLHGTRERSGNIYLTEGAQPIFVTFFELGGGENLTAKWEGPGISKQEIPVEVLKQDFAYPQPPQAPSQLSALATSYDQIDLTWVDNSNNETGFEVYRSTDLYGPYDIVATTIAGSTSYTDTGLQGSSTYYYKLRAVGTTGESNFTSEYGQKAQWSFNNDYSDDTGNGETAVPFNNPTFSNTEVREGSHALDLNGADDHLSIAHDSQLPHDAFKERTFAFWFKTDTPGNNEQVIFEEGGSTEGLAVGIDNGNLQVAIRHGGSGSQQNLFVPFNSTAWTHVAVVFDNGHLMLFVNGVLTAENLNVGFPEVNDHASGAGLGATIAGNSLGYEGEFDGYVDDLFFFDKPLSESGVALVMNSADFESFTTTLSLPPGPDAITDLTSTALSSSEIQVQWTDNAENEDGYKVYRSFGDNLHYRHIATLNPNTTVYNDTSLISNTPHYYKVGVFNIGGEDLGVEETSAQTLNNDPVLDPPDDMTVKFGSTFDVPLSSSDPDGNAISLSYVSAPINSFTSITDNGDGSGLLQFSPVEADLGSYQITVRATDSFGGFDESTFTLEVNDNYLPIMSSLNDFTLSEGGDSTITITASDLDDPSLTFSVTGLPSFGSFQDNGDNTATLTLITSYVHDGAYLIEVEVSDNKPTPGIDKEQFILTVTDVDPYQKIMVNFENFWSPGPDPWNNTHAQPNAGLEIPLVNTEMESTGYSLELLTTWGGSGSSGVTQNAIYHLDVSRSFYSVSSAGQQQVRLENLDDSLTYSFEFFGSRAWQADDRTAEYTIDGNTVSLNASSNADQTVKLSGIQPTLGEIVISIDKAPGAVEAYLNAMIIETNYDNGTPPEAPANLSATAISGTVIQLDWEDVSPDDLGTRIYRSLSESGPFDLIETLNGSATSFQDDSLQGRVTYYYEVNKFNDYGTSITTPVVNATTLNNPPAFWDKPLKYTIAAGHSLSLLAYATDEEGDNVSLHVEDLPPFATFYDYGIGFGIISIKPAVSDEGIYTFDVVATDSFGDESAITYTLTVTSKQVISYYINFNQSGSLDAGAPWNNNPTTNFTTGSTFPNLLDQYDRASNITITLLTDWANVTLLGETTGDNSGVVPDDVMQSSWQLWEFSQTLEVSGLAQDSVYNFTFFNSFNDDIDLRTVFKIQGDSATLDAANNTSETVTIKGIVPDINGEVIIDIDKAQWADRGHLNAMIIDSYSAGGTPVKPDNFLAAGDSKTSVIMTWEDNSINEDGFEIYRSLLGENNFTLIHTSAADVTSYADVGLSTNSAYSYKVRAFNADGNSAYSNVSNTSTFSYQVFVNLSRTALSTPATWNDTDTDPTTGPFTISNLLNGDGNPTTIDIIFDDPMFADGSEDGIITGDDSGIYPDNVMKTSYRLTGNGNKATVKIGGLPTNLQYNLTFFGSADDSGLWDNRAQYSVGSKSTVLNSSQNSSGTAIIRNLDPDVNGEISFDVQPLNWIAYLNTMVIDAYNPASVGSGSSRVDQQDTGIQLKDVLGAIKIYPNPFRDQITISTLNLIPENVHFQLMDMSGKILWKKSLEVGEGSNELKMDLREMDLLPGVYFLKASGEELGVKTYRLLRN